MGFITGLLKFIGIVVGAVLLIAGVTLTAAKFADGPWALISGGPFTTGTPAGAADAVALTDRQEVEFELVGDESSRTTWIMQANGRLFIPSGYMDTLLGDIWKHWPYEAEKDGRAILRVDGNLHTVTMTRIMADPDLDEVLSEIARKYGAAFGDADPSSVVASGSLWIFELIPS
jgi:hypothetical protein